MLWIEAYKIFKRKLVWLVLLGIFLIVISSVGAYFQSWFFDSSQYKILQRQLEQYEKFKGPLTDERMAQFLEEYIPEEYDYAEDFLEDGIPVPINKLYPDIKFDINFGYFTFWVFFLDYDLPGHLKYIPIFIVVAFSSLFTYEKECGMQEILLSTKKGRKECTRAKVAIAFLVTNAVYLLVWLLTIIPLLFLTKGIGWDSSIQMTPWLRGSQLNMDYLTLTLHTVFLSFVAINVILLITLCASFLVKSPMVAMCISFGVLFLWRPDVMSTYLDNTVVNQITAFTPVNVLNTMNLAKQVPVTVGEMKVDWLTIAEVFYSILLILGNIFFFRVLARHQKYYAS